MLPTPLGGYTLRAWKHRTSLPSDCSLRLKNSSPSASCKNVAARRNSWVRLRVVPGDGDESAIPALAGYGNLALLTLARQRRRADRLPQGDRTDPAAALLELPRRRQAQRG